MRFTLALAAALLVTLSTEAQNGITSTSARAGIDTGNQAWIEGIKAGDIPRIMATYADQSVDCGSTGECVTGKVAIESHMREQLAQFGKARSAAAKTWGSTQHGDFVYEWGRAEAEFEGGRRLVEKYLTVWQRQSDGSWKIFRNLVIP